MVAKAKNGFVHPFFAQFYPYTEILTKKRLGISKTNFVRGHVTKWQKKFPKNGSNRA